MTSPGSHADRRSRRHRRLLLAAVSTGAVLLMLVVVVSAISVPGPSRAPKPAPSALPTTPSSTPATTPTPAKRIDKVLVIMLENHSTQQIKKGAPRLTALAKAFGNAPKALAPCGHPSQPNYVCLSAGGKYLASNDIETLAQPDVWNNTLDSGRTMRVYADALPEAIESRRRDDGRYAARHVFTVPFVATPKKADNFARDTVNIDLLAADIDGGALPNVGAVIPDNCHNAHTRCSGEGPTQLKQADNWIADRIQRIQAGPDWKSGHLLIVVTADEDNKEDINDIPMIVIHPALKHYSTDVPVSLYSLGGLLADVGHTPRLGKQRTAPDFARAFGLAVATE